MSKPCPKCGVEQEIIAVDYAGHEMTGPCESCIENLKQRHIAGATVVEGNEEQRKETQG